MDICRLCTNNVDSSIEIFSEQGLRLNIHIIVAAHFSFQVNDLKVNSLKV